MNLEYDTAFNVVWRKAITFVPFFIRVMFEYNNFIYIFYKQKHLIILNAILYLYCFQNIPCNKSNIRIKQEPADRYVDRILKSKINRSKKCTSYDIDLEANLVLNFSSSNNSKKPHILIVYHILTYNMKD